MAMFRCGGGGKVKPITITVVGQDTSNGGGGMNRVAASGTVTLPNLGWTKVTCDANSNTVGGTVGSKVNGIKIEVGASRDITDAESISLNVGSNMTGSGLSGHDKVTATFTLS